MKAKTQNVPAARKIANATARPPAVNDSPVEFDAKHTNSPLCACRDCNEEWLKRRNQPISKKHEVKKLAVDVSRKDEYQRLFDEHGIRVSITGHSRSPSWHLMNTAKTWGLTTSFDVDLDRVLKQLAEGRTLAQVDLTFHSNGFVARTTAKDVTMTGGPFCVMCGEPGGLPSPNMVGGAKILGLRLFFEAGDARLGPARLHPGRCRKRLRQLLDHSKAQKGVSQDTCYAALKDATTK